MGEFPRIDYRPPEPTSAVPIGLIGCGKVAPLHLAAYQQADYDVVALCDLEEQRARELRETYYPDADVYTDHEDVLSRDDIRVADVATQPGPRPRIIEDALRADMHVMSQKPFVEDIATGEHLVELADERGMKLAVNQNGRWAPYLAYIKGAQLSGHLGELLGVQISLHWNHDHGYDSQHHLFYRFAIHFIDQIAYLFEESATQVYASTDQAPHQSSEAPLIGNISITYPAGHATIHLDGTVNAGVSHRTYVAGSERSCESRGPNEPWEADQEAPRRFPWEREQLTIFDRSGSFTPELVGAWDPNGFVGAMGELQCAIEEDREPVHSARDNLETMAICLAACASAVDGDCKRPGEDRRLSDIK